MVGGVLRGAGKQMIGAACNLVGHYIIGFPISVALMFAAHMGVVGKNRPLRCSPAISIVCGFISYLQTNSHLGKLLKLICHLCKRTLDRTYHLCVHAVHFLRHICVQTQLEEGYWGGVYLHPFKTKCYHLSWDRVYLKLKSAINIYSHSSHWSGSGESRS